MTIKPETRWKNFWARVDKTGACWLWVGTKNSYGYGTVAWGGRRQMVHRVAYEQLVGPIPDGLVIDHVCRVRNCVNPNHLEPVTNGENVLRGVSPSAICKRKRICKRGHAFTLENTIFDSQGTRLCRECKRVKDHLRAILNFVCPICKETRNWTQRRRHFTSMHPGALVDIESMRAAS